VRVVVADTDDGRTPSAVSDVVASAPPDAVIDISLAAVPNEFDDILRALGPPSSAHPMRELDTGVLDDLVRDGRLPRARVDEFAHAARVARDADIPTALAYGLVRSGAPDSLDELLGWSDEQIRAALDNSHAQGLIPEPPPAVVDDALSSLAKLRSGRTPLAELTGADGPDDAGPTLRALDQRGIRSLDDLRAVGGIALLGDPQITTDQAVVRRLDAHARLTVLGTDTATTERLIAAGWTSIGDVADAEPDALRRALGDGASAEDAVFLRRKAQLQGALINAVASGFAVEQANGFVTTTEDWRDEHPIRQVVPQSCGCDDCEAAVSPQAYLADLAQYALDHLRSNGQRIDLNYLESTFHQPFSELPATCDASRETVRQPRICIEVLRSALGPRPLGPSAREDALRRVERDYCLVAYQGLLDELGTSFTEIRLARGAPAADRRRLAERIGVAVTDLDSLFVDPAALSESTLETLFGLHDTTRPPLTARPAPSIRRWRLGSLRVLWSSQDWPADDFAARRRPIIDPDLLGPDDFREPSPKAAGAVDRAFDIWITRRRWVDDFAAALRGMPLRQTPEASGPDLSAIVGAMGTEPYHTHTWAWPAGALATLRDKLDGITPSNVGTTTEELADGFHVSVEAARRIVELWDKDSAFWEAPTRSPRLTPGEWGEVVSILVGVRKHEAAQVWIEEEIDSTVQRAQANELPRTWVDDDDSSQALLGPRELWRPRRGAAEGEWPPQRLAGQPLIDPYRVPRSDLPDPPAGRRALELWDQRHGVVQQQLKALEDELTVAGPDAMLTLALGPVAAPATSWSEVLRLLGADVGATDPVVAAAAKQVVEAQLRLTVENLQKTVRVLDLAAAGAAGPPPGKAEWADVFALLTRSWTVRTLHAAWFAEEEDPVTGVESWRCARHALTKWRTSLDDRTVWNQTLEVRGANPLIDPDILATDHLATPGSGPAWTLWDQRRSAIAAEVTALESTARNAAAFETAADTIVGAGTLAELSAAKRAGEVLGPRLGQLDVTAEELDEVLRVRDLLADPAASPVLDSEWQAACAVLTQVWKRRQFAEWRLAERTRDITAGPDLFRIPPVEPARTPSAGTPVAPAPRFDADALLAWRDRLQSRIDQERDVQIAIDDAVAAVEEQTLTRLRDGLALAADPQALSDAPVGRRLGDRLAIATEYGGCATTTRISQAIETLQIILWSVRMGTFADVHPDLELAAADFDQEWPWIGSYSTWRAAMFVHLYPENIALPSLRPVQSWAFRRLVDELRGARRLAPADARQAAERYARYVRDVCTLDVQATCSGVTTTSTGERTLAYGFGIGAETTTVYWSVSDPADPSALDPTFWAPVPGLEDRNATVIGADSYDGFSQRRHIYVFVKMESEASDVLAFNRYDLRTRTWQSDITTLKLPEGIGEFRAVLRPRADPTESPRVALQGADDTFFERSLDTVGADWEPGDWLPRDRLWAPWRSVPSSVLGGVLLTPGAEFFATFLNDPLLVEVVVPGQDGQPHALLWNGYRLDPIWTQENLAPLPGGLASSAHVSGVYRLGPKDIDLTGGGTTTQFTLPLVDVFAIDQQGRLQTIQRNSLVRWAPQWTAIAQPWGATVQRAQPIVRGPAALDVLSWLNQFYAITLFSATYSSGYAWSRSSAISGRYIVDPQTWNDEPTNGFVGLRRSPGRIELIRTHPSVLSDDFWTYSATSNPGAPAEASPRVLPATSGIAPDAPLAAVVRDPAHFDLFVPKDSGEIWTIRWSLAGWASWERIGSGMPRFDRATPVSGIDWTANHVVVVAADRDGVVQTTWQRDEIDESPWHPWAPVEPPAAPIAQRAAHVAVIRSEATFLTPPVMWVLTIGQDGRLAWTESMSQLPSRPSGAFSGHPRLWPDPLRAGVDVAASDIAVTDRLTPRQRDERRAWVASAFRANEFAGATATALLEEAFYFAPAHVALQLQKAGAYVAALDWFRLVYDYTAPVAQRVLVGRPPDPATVTTGYDRDIANWLRDPLNPHSIAATRSRAYVRFTLLSIIRCLLDGADAEFTVDSSESVPRARELYELALELLDSDDLRPMKGICSDIIGSLVIAVDDPHWEWLPKFVASSLSELNDPGKLKAASTAIEQTMAAPGELVDKYLAIEGVLADSLGGEADATLGRRLEAARRRRTHVESAVLSQARWALAMPTGISYRPTAVYVPQTVFDYCIPPNPLLRALRLRAELNVFKIRNCRNIAGLSRELEPFAAATDTVSGLPTIGSGGQLVVAGVTALTPTLYRFSFLIERAKQLAQQAMQVESSFLSALEKSDREAYDLISARANVQVAQASVRLQDLRVLEAADGIRSSELQRDRAALQQKTYEQWINAGLSPSELALLGWYDWLATFEIISVNLGALMQGITGGLSIAAYTGPFGGALQAAYQGANALKGVSDSLAVNAQREINRLNVLISQERRVDEWTLQKSLAEQDVRIGEQLIVLANDRARIVEQERTIEQMKADQARDTLEFLANKFTSKDLYDWMSGVLERVYSFFLQQATATAQLALQQLAFERQETPPQHIQNDYWEVPSDETPSGQGTAGPDRRGLTGAARLLQDITQLDQYAVDTRQREQHLTRTLSLAHLAPFAFQRFQATGVLIFTTPMELFDSDFPGHYLRLVRRVRTSVIALIPPTEGIRATLSSSGISRVTIGGDVFQTTVLRRAPEVIALTAPTNASGLFELQDAPELRVPFEGSGVATTWEFRMPKAANPFDYSTIADVLVTIEYTALDSFDHRQQLVREFNADRSTTASRAFGFRYEFADAWYDLHNPDSTATPMSVQFETSAADFPPNVDDVRIEHVEMYFVRGSGARFEFETVELRLDRPEGTSPSAITGTDAGLISSRAAGGMPLLRFRDVPPFGRWTLALPDTAEVRRRLADDVTDILFVLTYRGRLPEWPS
jgi:hypothetical protein